MQQRRDGVGGPLSALGLFSGSLCHVYAGGKRRYLARHRASVATSLVRHAVLALPRPPLTTYARPTPFRSGQMIYSKVTARNGQGSIPAVLSGLSGKWTAHSRWSACRSRRRRAACITFTKGNHRRPENASGLAGWTTKGRRNTCLSHLLRLTRALPVEWMGCISISTSLILQR